MFAIAGPDKAVQFGLCAERPCGKRSSSRHRKHRLIVRPLAVRCPTDCGGGNLRHFRKKAPPSSVLSDYSSEPSRTSAISEDDRFGIGSTPSRSATKLYGHLLEAGMR